MKTVIVTGSQGFIGTYICKELLDKGYKVVGFDDYSKYGVVVRPHDNHPNFSLVVQDLSKEVPDFAIHDPTYVILGAAKIGGISYFHKYAFDLVRDNERILANCYDAILECPGEGYDTIFGSVECYEPQLSGLRRVVTISSSMVYEGADLFYDLNMSEGQDRAFNQAWPSKESSAMHLFPAPTSTYGAQKLMCEYWALGAWEQYQLPYTIVRPFNAVGCYEGKALGESDVMSGNIKLQLSHVLPDLINKCLKGQDPLHILGKGNQVRCYTNGKDIARGIVMAMESDKAHNQAFNISNEIPHNVLNLAEEVWEKINPGKPFKWVEDKPFEHDVQMRLPDVRKAKELLGFEAKIGLRESIAEVIEWMKTNHD
jgi:UDP-glucose 4-epimerase